ALERRSGKLVSMTVERQLGGPRFNTVVQLCGSAVIVDVLHGIVGNLGFLESQSDSSRRLLTALLQPDPMIGFACGAIPGDFAINVCAPRSRPLQLFQYKEPRAFGNHKAVAVA